MYESTSEWKSVMSKLYIEKMELTVNAENLKITVTL